MSTRATFRQQVDKQNSVGMWIRDGIDYYVMSKQLKGDIVFLLRMKNERKEKGKKILLILTGVCLVFSSANKSL